MKKLIIATFFAITANLSYAADAAQSTAKTITFVCEHGVAKSVIAMQLFNKIAKERGVKLGTPNNLTYEDRVKGAQIRKENARKNDATERAFCLISTLRKTGESFGSIAKILNENSFKTARGGAFTTTQVIRVVSMFC